MGVGGGGGRGFSQLPSAWPLATFIQCRKIEARETPSCLIPRLLDVYIRQLEILVTALVDSLVHLAKWRKNLEVYQW